MRNVMRALTGRLCAQSITALAHLRAAVLYVLDISEQCGHSLAQQAALFHSIKPLFANKPLLVVANKVDATSLDGLAPEDRALIDEMVTEAARMSGGPFCRHFVASPYPIPSASSTQYVICATWVRVQHCARGNDAFKKGHACRDMCRRCKAAAYDDISAVQGCHHRTPSC